MNLRLTCFVRDENGNLKDRHTFYSDDEQTLYTIGSAFSFAMSRYAKDYKITWTPIQFNFWETNKEE